MAIVDLLAILPFYAPMVVRLDLRFLRALRLIRILRLLKLGRYSQAMQTIARVVVAKKEELLVTAFVVFILLLLGSAGLYYAEHDAQPEAVPSIPAAMWWGVVTLSTVGYGDIVPVTPAGRFLGAVVALLGIGMFALPTGILGAAFVEEVRRRRAATRVCPHCGRSLPPDDAARDG
jgi:voltage-gated potassium channel